MSAMRQSSDCKMSAVFFFLYWLTSIWFWANSERMPWASLMRANAVSSSFTSCVLLFSCANLSTLSFLSLVQFGSPSIPTSYSHIPFYSRPLNEGRRLDWRNSLVFFFVVFPNKTSRSKNRERKKERKNLAAFFCSTSLPSSAHVLLSASAKSNQSAEKTSIKTSLNHQNNSHLG